MISKRGRYRSLVYILVPVLVIGSLVAVSWWLSHRPPALTEAPEWEPVVTTTSVPPVTVELSEKVDSAGVLLEDVQVISGDSVAMLYLVKGTRVLDASQPLNSVTVTVKPPQAQAETDPTVSLSELAYDFSPRGATFDPPARLTLSYEPPVPLPGSEVSGPRIGYFREAESTWTWLDVTADLDIHHVTAEIDHLGTFIVLFKISWAAPAEH